MVSGKVVAPGERMKQAVLDVQQVRQVDQLAIEQYGMHPLVLMENAGLGCAEWLRGRFAGPTSVVILCGSGNNGGDGLVIARHLQTFGWPCRVVIHGPRERLSEDAEANLKILLAGPGKAIEIIDSKTDPRLDELEDWIGSAELVIDAMLGTGVTGAPRFPFDRWIELANANRGAGSYRVALDIPTGIDARTGQEEEPHFQTDATLTFVALKPAMNRANAARTFGDIAVIPIGIPATLIERILVDRGE